MNRWHSHLAAALLGAMIVVDGDTVKMDGVTYRLLGLDTPETFFARCGQERLLGNMATARLKQLIETTVTRIEPNGKSCRYRGRGLRLEPPEAAPGRAPQEPARAFPSRSIPEEPTAGLTAMADAIETLREDLAALGVAKPAISTDRTNVLLLD